jgi:hypothetical protein
MFGTHHLATRSDASVCLCGVLSGPIAPPPERLQPATQQDPAETVSIGTSSIFLGLATQLSGI